MATLGAAVRSCGEGISGVEFDYEHGATAVGKAGIVSAEERRFFTSLMDRMQRSMGGELTVSEDVGVWGVTAGSYPLEVTPWVDAEIMKRNPNLFVNSMSYHDPADCSIGAWLKDAAILHEMWGLPKSQINLGVGYFAFNLSWFPWGRVVGEPTWANLGEHCPNIGVDVCSCDGVPFAGKRVNYELGRLIAREGYRGAFPWAANYDAWRHNNSLVEWLGRGLGIIP